MDSKPWHKVFPNLSAFDLLELYFENWEKLDEFAEYLSRLYEVHGGTICKSTEDVPHCAGVHLDDFDDWAKDIFDEVFLSRHGGVSLS